MNVINFEQSRCRKIQTLLDSYLKKELPVETTRNLLSHIEKCSNCLQALELRRRAKDRLRAAVLREQVPINLQEKIRDTIRNDSSSRWTQWLLVAAATIALTAAGTAALQLWKGYSPASSELMAYRNDPDTQILKIGFDNHMHCAVDKGFAKRRFAEEEMYAQLGPDFGNLVAMVKARPTDAFELIVAHRCRFQGREFDHLILKGQQTAISLVLTKNDGQSFSRRGAAEASQSSAVALYEASFRNIEVTGFETGDYLAFVVSDLGRESNRQFASTMAHILCDFIIESERITG